MKQRRGLLLWFGLGAVLLGVAALAGTTPTRNDRPLDPTATGPHGAKAVVLLARELGAQIEVVAGAPEDGIDVALLLDDRADRGDRAAIRAWVRGGGRLVVADPGSPLAMDPDGCPEGIGGVERLSVGPGPSGSVERGEDCFDGFVSSAAVGQGEVVTVGNPRLFDNDHLDDADNSVLAADLLVPSDGARVAFLQGPAGSGDEALVDLIGPRVAQMLAELAVAFGLYLLWKGRRLGRPVLEPQPVTIAGSELVAAVGRMLAARRQPHAAAATVRADVRRGLERRLGLPADVAIDQLAGAVAARTGFDATWVAGALERRPITADADLVALLADLDRICALALAPAPVAGGTR